MTRMLSARLRIEGKLHVQSPLHVGGVSDDVETDLPLARNGQGNLYVPGTSLAGPLRAWMESRFGNKKLLWALWGWQEEKQASASDQGWASRIIVEDGEVKPPDGLAEEIWDGVGIDRQWGAAAENLKFDRAVLPRGSTVDLDMRVELPAKNLPDVTIDQMRAAVGWLLAALEKGDISLGAAGTRGLGRVRLEIEKLHEENWRTRTGVLDVLGNNPSKCMVENLKAAAILQPDNPHILHIAIHWRPAGPLMVKAGYDGIAVDALPMVSGAKPNTVALILPGSSLKGALRSHAERIVRTVLDDKSEWAKDTGQDRRSKSLDVPLVKHLFGAAKKAEKVTDAGRGVLTVVNCYAQNTDMAAEQWRNIAEATEFKNQPGFMQQGFHVAVDRWTGGAAENLLFSGIEPFGVQWEPLRLTLDFCRLNEELRYPAIALLLLLIRDLACNRLPIGFGVNRGYGSVEVQSVEFSQSRDQEWEWLNVTLQSPWDFNELPGDKRDRLQSEWRKWIDDNGGGRHG